MAKLGSRAGSKLQPVSARNLFNCANLKPLIAVTMAWLEGSVNCTPAAPRMLKGPSAFHLTVAELPEVTTCTLRMMYARNALVRRFTCVATPGDRADKVASCMAATEEARVKGMRWACWPGAAAPGERSRLAGAAPLLGAPMPVEAGTVCWLMLFSC